MAKANHLGAFEFPQGPKADYRDGGKIVLMARSGGYVMVKRPRCVPFVWDEKQWCACADWNPDAGLPTAEDVRGLFKTETP